MDLRTWPPAVLSDQFRVRDSMISMGCPGSRGRAGFGSRGPGAGEGFYVEASGPGVQLAQGISSGAGTLRNPGGSCLEGSEGIRRRTRAGWCGDIPGSVLWPQRIVAGPSERIRRGAATAAAAGQGREKELYTGLLHCLDYYIYLHRKCNILEVFCYKFAVLFLVLTAGYRFYPLSFIFPSFPVEMKGGFFSR